MKLCVLATGTSRGQDLTPLERDPRFRKATRNMMMGYAALTPILQTHPKLTTAAFVFGSSFGELQTTQEFLHTLASQGVARPLLFQNSLHNATLGFLALQLGVTGPTVTTSRRFFTGESCLEIASVLIDSGAKLCLALTVDSQVPVLESGLVQNYPNAITMDEGAAALLLASEATTQEMGLTPIAIIESVDLHAQGGEEITGPYSDSNTLEHLIQKLPSLSSEKTNDVRLCKPDGSYSLIRLSKCQLSK